MHDGSGEGGVAAGERREAAGARSLEHLRLITDAARAFAASARDFRRLLPLIAARLGETVGDLCAIRPLSDDGQWLEASGAVYHRDPALLEASRAAWVSARQRVGEGLSGRVAASGQVDFTPRVDPVAFAAGREPRLRAYLEQLHVTSAMVVPIACEGEVLGVANLLRGRGARPYDEDELRLVQALCDHAALAIANARAHAALAREIEARRAAESRFERLAESGLIGIVVAGLDGQIHGVNGAVLEMVGYSREEILGGAVAWRELTPPEWREQDARALEELQRTGVVKLREKEYLRKDGARVPVLVGTAMTSSAAGETISFVLDVTERRRALRALEEVRVERAAAGQRARLASIVDATDDAIISKSLDGLVASWNAGAERLFGFTAAQAIGRPIAIIIPRDRLDEEREILAAASRGEVRRLDTVRLREGIEPVEVAIAVSPIRDAAGQIVGVCKVARDIGWRKRAEAELARSRDLAEAASRELEAFSYSVAHDLRAPLRGMNGLAQILLEDHLARLDGEGQECLREIQANAEKMGALIDALLSLSRVTRGDWRPERIDLAALFRASAAQLAAAEPARKVELVAPPTLFAEADPQLMRALFDNLVGNAWKFTAQRAAARIELGLERAGGAPAIFVRDDGAGFDMAHAKKLFTPFQRMHTVREFAGTGIGLATVQRIVHRHGGRIWAEAKVGEGAAFRFTLPGLAPGA